MSYFDFIYFTFAFSLCYSSWYERALMMEALLFWIPQVATWSWTAWLLSPLYTLLLLVYILGTKQDIQAAYENLFEQLKFSWWPLFFILLLTFFIHFSLGMPLSAMSMLFEIQVIVLSYVTLNSNFANITRKEWNFNLSGILCHLPSTLIMLEKCSLIFSSLMVFSWISGYPLLLAGAYFLLSVILLASKTSIFEKTSVYSDATINTKEDVNDVTFANTTGPNAPKRGQYFFENEDVEPANTIEFNAPEAKTHVVYSAIQYLLIFLHAACGSYVLTSMAMPHLALLRLSPHMHTACQHLFGMTMGLAYYRQEKTTISRGCDILFEAMSYSLQGLSHMLATESEKKPPSMA